MGEVEFDLQVSRYSVAGEAFDNFFGADLILSLFRILN